MNTMNDFKYNINKDIITEALFFSNLIYIFRDDFHK